jgi:carboxyl-terminal processing protease
MQLDDDKDQGGSEPQPEGGAVGPNNAPAPTPNAWQPAPPPGWNAAPPPSWGPPPAAPGFQSQWPPQPSAPPSWQNPGWQQSPVWPPQPQQGWGAPSTPRQSSLQSKLPQVVTIVAACLLAFSGGLLTDHVAFAQSTSGSGANSGQSSALYNEALQVVKQDFVGRNNVTDQQLLYGSIAGMVNSLGDTGHSEFLSASEYAAMQSQLNASSIAGIGVVLSDDNGLFKVDRVLGGSPASQAGVKAGDQITAVGGKTTANMTFNDLTTLIRGDAGTSVTITVIHLGTSTPVDITMTRATIKVPLAVWGMVPGTHVADISLAEFSSGAADQVQADITSATAAGASAIILDLRGNPGGYADEAREVASEFLSSGTVYIQQDAAGNDTKYTVDDKREHTTLPLVVLVDHDSASSSEIVTGALQDSGRAKVVGVNTFGTGTVLQPFKLSDGSVIILGTSWWLTPDGHRIFGVGITPDQKVLLQGTALPTDPSDLTAMTATQFASSTDAQLVAAVADLK